MQLPGDELGRSWIAAQFEGPHEHDSVLLTLVAVSLDGQLVVVGNAFIIYGHEHQALCLTAAHNFEFVKALRQMHAPQSHPTLPPDFRIKGVNYLKTDHCHAFGLIDGTPISCKVGQVNFIEHHDVAVFTVHSDDTAPIFPSKLAVDLSMPQVGDEVAVLGHILSSETTGSSSGFVKRELVFWHGVVTRVTTELGRMRQIFSFETTIPVRPGMSGSPFLKKPTPGGVPAVVGIASHDFSEPEAFADFRRPGNSTAAMLWPSMGLAFQGDVEHEVQKALFLGDLVERKIIDDRSDRVKVTAKTVGQMTEILYVDGRSKPPLTWLLETTGHPFFV